MKAKLRAVGCMPLLCCAHKTTLLPLFTMFLMNSVSARAGQRLSCTYGVMRFDAGEETFGFFDLGPEAIRLAAQRHELSVVSLRTLPVCRELGRTRRAV